MKLTAKLLNRAADMAERHHNMTRVITEAFRDRYGVTHSDVDCDEIIDILDYGLGGSFTLKGCDELMTAYGAPPLKKGQTRDDT